MSESTENGNGKQSGAPSPCPMPWVGIGATVTAFAIWGLSPLYWRHLVGIAAPRIAMHRVVWSLVFLSPFLLSRHARTDLMAVLRDRSRLRVLLMTACLLAGNWTIYIWAVTHDRVLHASLGYYINPLVNVALGVVFLGERLRRAQTMSVGLAATAVCLLTIRLGALPWVAVGLAGTFGLYALLRKQAAIGPRTGLTVETLCLGIPSLIVLGVQEVSGAGVFGGGDAGTVLLLMVAGPLTAVPLLLFTLGAKRLRLATVGLAQYLAPTLMFLLAVLRFGEPFSLTHGLVFLLIWSGLFIYSLDAYRGRWLAQGTR